MTTREKRTTIICVLVVLVVLCGNLLLTRRSIRAFKQQNTQLQQKVDNLRKENLELRTQNERLASELFEERNAIKCGDTYCSDGRCYGVQHGDTLWHLSARFYGDPRLWTIIANKNGISDPRQLQAETCICIPAVEAKHKSAVKKLSAPTTIIKKKVSRIKQQKKVTAPIPQTLAPETKKKVEQIKLPKETAVLIPQAPKNEMKPIAPPPPTEPVKVAVATAPVAQPPAINQPPAEKPKIPEPQVKPIAQPAMPQIQTARVEIKDKHISLPGNFWSSGGNLSPVEKGNIQNYSHAEQGLMLFKFSPKLSLVPYVSLDSTVDTKGFDWNNKLLGQAGVKLVRTFDHGVVQLGGAYAQEYRWKSGLRADQPIAYASYWFGWDQPTRATPNRKFFSAFPGSTWGIVGNISPVEKGNVIGTSYIQQGTTLTKIAGLSIIPFAEYALNKDTRGYDWNNRQIYGGGIKMAYPVKVGIIEFGSAYTTEKRFNSGLTESGFKIFGNIWFGWNARK